MSAQPVRSKRAEKPNDSRVSDKTTRSGTLRVFDPVSFPQGRPSRWRIILKAMSPHQWAKNALVFLPLVLAHEILDASKLATLSCAFAILSACASAVYLVNDVVDRDADRAHPIKRKRPVAAGLLSVQMALAVATSLFVGAFALASIIVSWEFAAMLAVYVLLTTAYFLYLKRTLFLDVLVLAGLYTYRVFAGAMVADVTVSHWLMGFSMFLFVRLVAQSPAVLVVEAREGLCIFKMVI